MMKTARDLARHRQPLHADPSRARRGFRRDATPRRRPARPARCARRRPGASGCGAYCTSSPASSGPAPRPPMLATVATAAARARQFGGAASMTAAVAVPVKMPADKPGQHPADQQQRHRVGDQEHHGAGQGEGRPGQQHRASADRVGPAAERQQREQHTAGVRREDHRGRQHREVHAFAVERVHRRRQRGADHDRREGVGQQREGEAACVSRQSTRRSGRRLRPDSRAHDAPAGA